MNKADYRTVELSLLFLEYLWEVELCENFTYTFYAFLMLHIFTSIYYLCNMLRIKIQLLFGERDSSLHIRTVKLSIVLLLYTQPPGLPNNHKTCMVRFCLSLLRVLAACCPSFLIEFSMRPVSGKSCLNNSRDL